MKFKTSDLIARIDQKIADRTAEAQRKTAESEANVARGREEWLENSEHWTKFANRVKDKIRKGRPILASDIPSEISRNARYSPESLNVFAPSKPRKFDADTADLESMKATLKAVTDEEITTTGLKEIGFKNIRNLFA